MITQKEIDWFKYGIDPYEEEHHMRDMDIVIKDIQEFVRSEGPQTPSETGYILGYRPEEVERAITLDQGRRIKAENGLIHAL